MRRLVGRLSKQFQLYCLHWSCDAPTDGALWVQASGSITTEFAAQVSLNGGLLTFLAGASIDLDGDVHVRW